MMATTREEKRNLLNRLAGELGQPEDVERASLFTAEELEAPMDVVRCLITETGADLLDLLAECFFLPVQDEEDVMYFNIMVTLIQEMKDDIAPLAEALSRLNIFLPIGCFAVDEENGVVFKISVPMLYRTPDEDKMTTMLTAFDTAMGILDKYESYIMLVATGEIEPGEMMDLILNR